MDKGKKGGRKGEGTKTFSLRWVRKANVFTSPRKRGFCWGRKEGREKGRPLLIVGRRNVPPA